MKTEAEIRKAYVAAIVASIGMERSSAENGVGGILTWVEGNGEDYTYIGYCADGPFSGRVQYDPATFREETAALLDGFSSGMPATNVHPDEIGGPPPGLDWQPWSAEAIPSRTQPRGAAVPADDAAVLQMLKDKKVTIDEQDILTAFTDRIDVSAAFAMAEVALVSGGIGNGGTYDELRRTTGLFGRVLRGWPYLFASAYVLPGVPTRKDEDPASYAARLFVAMGADDPRYEDVPPTPRLVEVLQRLRGLHPTDTDLDRVDSAIRLASSLPSEWIPPGLASSDPEAVAEWEALVEVAHELKLQAERTGVSACLPTKRPSSWRALLEEMQGAPEAELPKP